LQPLLEGTNKKKAMYVHVPRKQQLYEELKLLSPNYGTESTTCIQYFCEKVHVYSTLLGIKSM